jgi:hypothetical protein
MQYIGHSLSKLSHHSGKIADVTEHTDHARKGHMKNIREHFYFSYIYSNELILVDEQKINDNSKISSSIKLQLI